MACHPNANARVRGPYILWKIWEMNSDLSRLSQRLSGPGVHNRVMIVYP
jgi:hypothetical protein